MGADGWVYILDADIVDAHGFNVMDDFNSPFTQTFMGKRIYTVYGDTEHHRTECDDCLHTIEDYEEIPGAVIDHWMLWT